MFAPCNYGMCQVFSVMDGLFKVERRLYYLLIYVYGRSFIHIAVMFVNHLDTFSFHDEFELR